MPRVHTVEHARKDYPSAGIKKGDKYYYWTFRFGGKHMSTVYPKPSQLTSSDFLQRIYGFQEQIEELSNDLTADDIESQVQSIIDELRDLASEQEDKLSNMPDQLQSSPNGEMLQNRADSVNEMADELENIDYSVDEVDTSNEEIKEPHQCDKCEKAAISKIADDDYVCQEHLTEWLEEKKEEQQELIDNLLSEVQGVSYNGE